jgi:alanine racemase
MQIERFKRLYQQLTEAGMSFEDVHTSASDGICFYPEACAEPFTLVRSGIIMYGCNREHQESGSAFKSVLSLKSRLGAVRKIRKGEGIGYGHTLSLPENALVGTIPAGYADGVPLALSNAGSVLIRGVRCPVIGRVSMDCTTVLLDGVPDAEAGDEVIFWGRSGNEEIAVCDWADLKNTHAHDILCAIGNRVERRFI